jgi:prepilin-type N-terminal cleavage/methylation domain-containing protein
MMIKMNRKYNTRNLSRPGFTLVELLVVILLSSIVIAAVWRGLDQSNRLGEVAAGMAVVWERLSLASDLLVTDARLAAWEGSPNSDIDPFICPKPGGDMIRGIIVDNGDSVLNPEGALLESFWENNVNIDPDGCLFQSTPITQILRTSEISENSVSFTTDPTIIGDELNGVLPMNETQFEDLFTGRFLRITSPNGFSQFVQVTDTQFSDLTVTVNPTPVYAADAGLCGVLGTGSEDHTVSVHHYVRYRILPNPGDDTRTALVREELSLDLETLIPGSQLVVGENIVDLQCWADGISDDLSGDFFSDGRSASSVLSDDRGTANVSPDSDNVHRARVFHFQLSGRTDTEFAGIAFQPRNSLPGNTLDLLSTYDIDGNSGTAAIVQSLSQQVELTNFVVRNLQ